MKTPEQNLTVWNLIKVNSKTPERRQLRRFGVFNVKFEQASFIVVVFSLLTLKK